MYKLSLHCKAFVQGVPCTGWSLRCKAACIVHHQDKGLQCHLCRCIRSAVAHVPVSN